MPTGTMPATRQARWFEFNHVPRPRTVWVLGIAGSVIFVLLWQWAAMRDPSTRQLFPPPTAVVEAILRLFAEQDFAADVIASLRRIVVSFAIACVIALPIGVLMGAFATVNATLNPLVSAFRYLPATAFIPLFLMWLGTGEAQKLALLVVGVVFFLITLIMDNTRAVRRELVETAMTLGGDRRQILWTVVVPACLPAYVDTMRQMLAVGWTYLVVAEIVATTDGIGAMMMRAKRFVHVDEIMAGIVVIGVLGLVTDALFRLLHRTAFPYLRHAR